MSMILTKVTDFLKQNKKIMYYLGLFALIYFAMGDSVFATDHEDAATEAAKSTLSIVNVIFIIAGMFIGLLTQLVALFLNPGWINGDIIGIAPHLKTVWIMISNLVYFIFAILLIVIAFMNIIGKGDKWELKQALPKFIVGVLIVPFSWFFIQFILSISAILTVSALTLPFDTFPEITNKYANEPIIPNNCVMNIGDKGDLKELSNLPANATKEQLNAKVKEIYKCDGEMLTIKDLMGSGDSIFSIMSIYTYGILRIDQFDVISEGDLDWVKTLISLGVSGIINILFVLIMLILLVSIALALFTRGIWLWLYAMFSPIFGLLYFFDKAGGGGEGAMKKFSISEFIKLALVPVYVSLALSFGLFFLFVVSTSLNASGTNNTKNIQLTPDGVTLSVGKLNYSINGSMLATENSKGKTLFAEIQGGVGTLIINLMALVVLWMSVMAALKTSEITGAIIQPIAEFGESIGKLAMKSPQYAPIFGGVSARGLQKMGTMPSSSLETRAAKNVGRFQKHSDRFFGANSVDVAKIASIENQLRLGVNTSEELVKLQAEIKGLINEHGTDNSTVRDLMGKFATGLANSTKLGVTSAMAGSDKLFAGNRLSSEGYGMLHADFAGGDVKETSADKASTYASSHRLAGGTSDEQTKGAQVSGDYYKTKIDTDQYNKLSGLKLDDGANKYNEINGVGFIEVAEENDKIIFIKKTDTGGTKHTLNTEGLTEHKDFDHFSNNDKKEWISFYNELSGSEEDKTNLITEILNKSGSDAGGDIAKKIVIQSKLNK